MFNSKKTSSGNSVNVSKTVPPSLLSSDLVVNGNLESSGDVQIDGSIDGDVKSG